MRKPRLLTASDLDVDDRYDSEQAVGRETLKSPAYRTVCLIPEKGGKEFASHSDGSKWPIHGKQFNIVPNSIAREYVDVEGYYVISIEEKNFFCKEAEKVARADNKDIVEYNEKAKAHNRSIQANPWDEKGDRKKPMQLKKWRRTPGNTPFAHFIKALQFTEPTPPKKGEDKK